MGEPLEGEPGFSTIDEGPSHFTLRATLQGHNVAVTSLAVAQDHNVLVSGSRDSTAVVWNVRKLQEVWADQLTRLIGHNHFVSGVSLSGDMSHLITCSWDKTVRMWDLSQRVLRRTFLGHSKDILALAWSPDNRRIVTVGRDKEIMIWTIRGETKYRVPVPSWGTSISCSPTDGENDLTFGVGFWNGAVRVWRLTGTGQPQILWSNDRAHSSRVNAVMFTPDGQFLFSGGEDRQVLMWSIQTGERRMQFKTRHPVTAVATSPTHAWVCAAAYDGIYVFDVQAQQPQIDLIAPEWPSKATKDKDTRPNKKIERVQAREHRHPEATALAWADDGSVLYAGYSNGDIIAWEVRSGLM